MSGSAYVFGFLSKIFILVPVSGLFREGGIFVDHCRLDEAPDPGPMRGRPDSMLRSPENRISTLQTVTVILFHLPFFSLYCLAVPVRE
jgi:hypothetical protein